MALSCEKNQEYDPSSIIGKWDWLGTIGDPGPTYPTEDYQRVDEYTKDSIHKIFYNGELTIERSFRTFNNSKIGYEDNYKDLYDYEITNDSLIISLTELSFIFYFKRLK